MNHFPPNKQRGLFLHTLLIVLFIAIALAAAYGALRASAGIGFTLFVIFGLAALSPVPFLVYRWYALLRADYQLDRETLRLMWGLRLEEIPLADVEWVRPAETITTPLSLPLFSMAGSVLGTIRHADLGTVEFMAADAHTILLIATRKQVFAISPADAAKFVQAFQHAIELGSLTPVQAQSQYPSFVVVQAWTNSLARYLWLTNILLNIGLAVWVSILATTLTRIPLGFMSSGAPGEPVPALALILLPLVSLTLSVAGWLAGLYFYPRKNEEALAFVLWASGAVMSLLFLIAVLFIVTTPV
jgi:hypothetical protein